MLPKTQQLLFPDSHQPPDAVASVADSCGVVTAINQLSGNRYAPHFVFMDTLESLCGLKSGHGRKWHSFSPVGHRSVNCGECNSRMKKLASLGENLQFDYRPDEIIPEDFHA